ncbi:MAG: fumarylacetoacetate hydrolase family protein [Thermoplasmatales archaeon]|nr:fumarylacetoacetate hydrolase family protein [Thermoplasmatales archaeon]MCW6170229.1 fumarylacetoacetate hydrolase family protein [Thermoplasmatales archaeon]
MNILKNKKMGKSVTVIEQNGAFYDLKDTKIASEPTVQLIEDGADLGSLIGDKVKGEITYDLPVIPRKMFLPALNFKSHVSESNSTKSANPYFFTKFQNALVPNGGSVVKPRGISRFDYEGEIGIIIGKKGKYLSREEALEYVFGYTIVDDVSIRDYQMNTDPSYGKDFVMGKCADTALPIGPWITTADSINFNNCVITTYVNGELRQNGSVNDMIFSVGELISRISQIVTLEPGDLISTGTPSGVAEHSSRRFLSPGDVVEIEVAGIGSLKHKIIDDTYTR